MYHPIRHFRVITSHRHRVIAHCFRAGIGLQGLFHDLSKYSPAEFWTGAKFFQGTRSPNAAERDLKGYSEAWMHHKGRNRHHFEYWRDYSHAVRGNAPVKMPLRFVMEMFCDRVAASKIYRGKEYDDGHPLRYFRGGPDKYEMHPETAALLESLLCMLAKQGEAECFAYLRSLDARGEYPKALPHPITPTND
ncbi:MAG: catalase [Clostridia bacterium]|nr:catalase [Clostridia bacterium]